MATRRIPEPAREVPVASEVDVAVVGGGCAGIAAAVAAARNGARVAFIERLGFYGGCVTATMMTAMSMFRAGDKKAVEGIGMEMIQRLKGELDGVQGDPAKRYCFVDSEKFKLMADIMVQEAGIEPWLHSLAVQPYMDGSLIKGVMTESKSGRQAILAKVVVDASGDGDIAARAGAPFAFGRPQDGRVAPVSTSFLLTGVDVRAMLDWVRDHPDDRHFAQVVAQAIASGDWTVPRRRFCYLGYEEATGELPGVNATRVLDVDPTNVRDLTRAEIQARKQIYEVCDFVRKYIPGGKNARVAAIATQLAPRESRRILGDYVLRADDVINGSQFPDAIAKFSCFWDLHNPTGDSSWHYYPAGMERLGMAAFDRVEEVCFAKADVYDIPYRSLVPQKIDNLLMAGRCISAEHEAVASIRYLPASFAIGQAAGTAATMAALGNTTPRKLDVGALRKRLAEQGAYLGDEAIVR